MKTKQSKRPAGSSLLANLGMERMIDRREGVVALQKLNEQERMVTVAIWKEYRDRDIEKLLGMSRGSLRWAVQSILKKLNRKTRVGVALIFERALHPSNGKISPWKPL